MKSSAVGNDFSIPIEYELAVGLVVAGATAGFSRISGVSSPQVAAIYSLGSNIGGMLVRHSVHLGVEYLGSVLGLSEEVKTGGKFVSELVIGHSAGQMIAQDLFHREVTHLDALKLRTGTGVLAGSTVGVALWALQLSSQPSKVELTQSLKVDLTQLSELKLTEEEMEAFKELLALLEDMTQEGAVLELLPLENSTKVI